VWVGSTALRFTAGGASLAARRKRILPMNRMRQKTETAEIKFPRNVAGYALKNQIRNSDQKRTKYIQFKH
jgi:hypothetical protein